MHKGATKHGMAGAPIYGIWARRKKRSLLCIEWQTFEAFFAGAGNPPDGECLRRPDPSKPLGPGNAVWLTPEEHKAMTVERRVDEYAALTGEAREVVAARFRRITRQRQHQLLLNAKGVCHLCHGILVWLGDGKACLCHNNRGPRRRHWRERIMLRLQNDEGMSTEEARLAMVGRSDLRGRRALVAPFDFRERCRTVGGVDELAAHYQVCAETIYKWIKRLGLKRKIVYVAAEEAK